ncbi:hypothetical protein UT300005_28420 [Clostridium sp. CTA-5]
MVPLGLVIGTVAALAGMAPAQLIPIINVLNKIFKFLFNIISPLFLRIITYILLLFIFHINNNTYYKKSKYIY